MAGFRRSLNSLAIPKSHTFLKRLRSINGASMFVETATQTRNKFMADTDDQEATKEALTKIASDASKQIAERTKRFHENVGRLLMVAHGAGALTCLNALPATTNDACLRNVFITGVGLFGIGFVLAIAAVCIFFLADLKILKLFGDVKKSPDSVETFKKLNNFNGMSFYYVSMGFSFASGIMFPITLAVAYKML